MAFLDNSGDIILDAVLTDTGRARLAKGDGSFKIAKFALGDDEIDYALYDLDDPSGSAYFDLEIMQTPILEAFTNNTSTMKSKLISIPRTNILYLPILKFNGDTTANGGLALAAGNLIYTAVDTDTETSFATSTSTVDGSIIRGVDPGNNSLQIVIDQGLNTNEIANTQPLSGDLIETQYIIEIDNRFGSIVGKNGNNLITVNPSFIDDDQVASYYLSLGTDTNFVKSIVPPTSEDNSSILDGPVGTRLMFLIQASLDLQSSTFLFQQLGTTSTLDLVPIYQIDSVVRITGATTGYRVDIPIRFVKQE